MRKNQWKHPGKTKMNLAAEEGQRVKRACWLLVCVLLGGLAVTVGIWMPIASLREARESFLQIKGEIRDLEQQLSQYEQIEQRYRRYDDSAISSQEKQLPDRLEMLQVIDACFSQGAEVLSVHIEESRALVSGTHENLQRLSRLVERLRQEPAVSDATVSSARTQESTGRAAAEVVIDFVIKGEGP